MMLSDNGVLVLPSNHSRVFDEVANGIRYSLMMLEREMLDAARPIIFNAHTDMPSIHARGNAILFNTEQVPTVPFAELAPGWRQYVEKLRQHVVWDYSKINIERLKALGIERVVHCPISYWSGLENGWTGKLTSDEEVDVLFVGSMNQRRSTVITQLALDHKLKVKTLFGVYGDERNEWMRRAKVILNMHYYPHPIHEVFRTSHAVANAKCVVTEGGGCDPDLEEFARRTQVVSSYDNLASTCKHLVEHESFRVDVEHRGYEYFSRTHQMEAVKQALKESE